MQTTLHLELRRLIEEKSKRDNSSFTACQLAQALGMPRSMITKLTHPDESKRVTNPRIETLMKIFDFFRSDGFSVTLENLLGIQPKEIDINDQSPVRTQTLRIPIYSLSDPQICLGKVAIQIGLDHDKVLAFKSNKPVKPFFKTGSVFIVDQKARLEDGVLIAAELTASNGIDIKKYRKVGHKVLLEPLDPEDKTIPFLPTTQIKILGVVVQINA